MRSATAPREARHRVARCVLRLRDRGDACADPLSADGTATATPQTSSGGGGVEGSPPRGATGRLGSRSWLGGRCWERITAKELSTVFAAMNGELR